MNDEGWDTSFSEWLKVSRLDKRDALLVFSVGGGNKEKNVSMNLVRAIELARERQARRYSGSSARTAARPSRRPRRASSSRRCRRTAITPHTEGLCAVVWHLLVTHPALKRAATKWESTR